MNHLRAKHPDECKKYTGICDIEKKRKAEEVMQSGKKHRVQTVEFLLEKKKPFEANNPRQLIINKKIIEMIAADAMPFSMINNVGFTRFLNELEPLYVIPSEVHLSRTLIPDLYSAVKSKIVILLEQAAYISFTSDMWTSTNNLNAFISLTAHWIDSEWNRMSIVLSLRNLEDRHTGQVISDNILAMLAAWSIPDEKRGFLVQDNGASMKKAAELSGLDHLGCFTHTIQLVVKVGLLSQRSVMDAIVTARAIVGHFRHSTQATEQLLRIQKSLTCEDGMPYPTHCLIQDVTTRWNSTFYMLERLIEQKKAIALYCQENDGVTNLMAHEWNLMERVLITLRPFEQETRNASMSTATASMIIPSVRVLMATLTKPARVGDDIRIQTMRADMLKDLHTGYEEVETNKLCALATVLDPTYKLLVFNAHGHDAVKRMLMDELQIEYEKTITAVNIPASTEVDPGPSTLTGLDSYYQELFASSTSYQNLDSASLSSEFTRQHELDLYLAEKNQLRTSPPTDPVIYWKSWKKCSSFWQLSLNVFVQYRPLASIVKEVLAPQVLFAATNDRACPLKKRRCYYFLQRTWKL